MTRSYRFRCPHCGATTSVDGSMREDILSEGCVICQKSVTEAAFSA